MSRVPLPLPSDEAHLWYADPLRLADPRLVQAYADLLDPDEDARWRRYRVPNPQHEYLVTRALVRTVLSRYAPEVDPREWRFLAGPHGRPEISSPAYRGDLRF